MVAQVPCVQADGLCETLFTIMLTGTHHHSLCLQGGSVRGVVLLLELADL